MKRAKIYISDEGYGPIVRQSAIVSDFIKKNETLVFDIQTYRNFEFLKKLIPDANHIRKFNNINWAKNIDGSPDLAAIESFLSTYQAVSSEFIVNEVNVPYDFVISDFVYEAFEIYKNNTPIFGVCHFTWDWFFSKLFPPVSGDYQIVRNWINSAKSADLIFFPPFTPNEILSCYKKNSINVPLIVREKGNLIFHKQNNKPNILLIDSGSSLSQLLIDRLLPQFSKCEDFNFYIVSGLGLIDADNVFYLSSEELLSDYIPHMDLVIGRAGFNTISECIASRVVMVLFCESNNPEMNDNILSMNGLGFGSFVNSSILENSLFHFLDSFFSGDYFRLKNNLQHHDIKTNGSEVIVEYILNYCSR